MPGIAPNYLRGIEGNKFKSYDRSEVIMTKGEKIARFLRNRNQATIVMVAIGIFAIPFGYATGFGFVPLFAALILYLWAMSQEEYAPMKMPILDNELDYKDTIAGKVFKGKGVFYVGLEKLTKKEIWLTNTDCCQHFLVIGTTGSGKTEMLLGFCANFLSWGSGLIFIDGKGDAKGMASIFALVKRWGRDADFRVINFLPPQNLAPGQISTNSFNPYTSASAADMTNLTLGLMAVGKEDVWSQRARQLTKANHFILAWARDNGKLDVNASVITRYMELPELLTFLTDDRFADLPTYLEEQLLGYICSLPNFQRSEWNNPDRSKRGKKPDGKPVEVSDKAFEQHTYLLMQLSGPLALLTSDFRHIFMAEYGDVDFLDAFFNRRIVVVLLPGMSTTPEQCGQMGRICVSAIKSMASSCLGSIGQTPDSLVEDVILLRPANSPSSYGIVMDELSAYLVPGIGIMAAQVRSLGLSMIFASQDETGLTKFDEKEKDSIIGNTNTQFYMRLQDDKAIKRAIDAGGQEYRARTSEMTRDTMSMDLNAFREPDRINLQKENRVDGQDVRGQKMGEFHLEHADYVIRGDAFYTAAFENYKNEGNISVALPQFLTIRAPDVPSMSTERNVPKLLKKFQKREELVEDIAKEIEENCFENVPPEFDILFSVMNGDERITQNRRFNSVSTPFSAIFTVALASGNAVDDFAEEVAKETFRDTRQEKGDASGAAPVSPANMPEAFTLLNGDGLDGEEAFLREQKARDNAGVGVEINEGGIHEIEPSDVIDGEGIIHLGEPLADGGEDEFDEVPDPVQDWEDGFAVSPEELRAREEAVREEFGEGAVEASIREVSETVMKGGGLSLEGDDEVVLTDDEHILSGPVVNPLDQETGSSKTLAADHDLPPYDEYSRQSNKLAKAVVNERVDDSNIRNFKNSHLIDGVNRQIEAKKKTEEYFRLDDLNFEEPEAGNEKSASEEAVDSAAIAAASAASRINLSGDDEMAPEEQKEGSHPSSSPEHHEVISDNAPEHQKQADEDRHEERVAQAQEEMFGSSEGLLADAASDVDRPAGASHEEEAGKEPVHDEDQEDRVNEEGGPVSVENGPVRIHISDEDDRLEESGDTQNGEKNEDDDDSYHGSNSEWM